MGGPERASVNEPVLVGERPLCLEDVRQVALGARVQLTEDAATREKLERAARAVEHAVTRGERIYGVTTGFGDACQNDVPEAAQALLARNLHRYHRAGVGPVFPREETRAILLARLVSLARGHSGVRTRTLLLLAELLNRDVLPQIPCRGSVGASGDLTPLAYVAAALEGEGTVTLEGAALPAADALGRVGLSPLTLAPKESLSLMNGTSAMTGVAILGWLRAERLGRFAAALTALAVETLHGEPAHFDRRIFELKAHPGPRTFAEWVRADLGDFSPPRGPDARLQDRYSVRCAPHVVGVLLDVLPEARRFLEIELESVNDNPLVVPETGELLRSGNFYGGHVCHAADSLKVAVANVADLLDRQLALLVDSKTNAGLPRDLVLAPVEERIVHHGFKAMQITASALTAEALKLTLPASVFSRSTESHNQDKVSLGTIAARDLSAALDLVETVAVVHLLALCQAVDARGGPRSPRARALHAAVRAKVPSNVADRPMDDDVGVALTSYRSGELLGD
ncbi:MAG TPA: aromatic amino acid ammonia-lyase [Polyangiaceae bacterium]|nr:aromatic amino acid ammonia-lyase [Polyangiaceae bacterium]